MGVYSRCDSAPDWPDLAYPGAHFQCDLHHDIVKSIQILSRQSNRINLANRFKNRLANQNALKYIFSQSDALH